MLSNLFTFVKAKGSSLPLPAHGWVGARATSSLAAHFAKQNTNSVGVQSEGEAEGGCGGEFRLARASKFSVRIFAEKSSDFVQNTEQIKNTQKGAFSFAPRVGTRVHLSPSTQNFSVEKFWSRHRLTHFVC